MLAVSVSLSEWIHTYRVPFRRVNKDSLWPFLASFQAYVLAERDVACSYKENRVSE